ncbi:uncharacterized protein LOC135811819 [Sycon ciliatum]|uniref:uncharacterized protein LOC135811819 n=1 Tax=Sycon ciliatum TaxID=27933 RepID=UPI0031F5FCB5
MDVEVMAAATAAVADASATANHHELHIGNLPKGTEAKAVVDALQSQSGFTFQVLTCSVKHNSRSGKSYALASVESKSILQKIVRVSNVGPGIRIDSRKLQVNPSNRSGPVCHTRPEQISTVSVKSFSLGVFMERRNTFFHRWSSSPEYKAVKCTMNLDDNTISLQISSDAFHYMLKFSIWDLDSYVVMADSYGTAQKLALCFNLAAEVYRIPQAKNTGDLEAEEESSNDMEYVFDDAQSPAWERTLDTFTTCSDVLGQYFHVLLDGSGRPHLTRFVCELQNKYEDLEFITQGFNVMPLPITLSRRRYDQIALKYNHRFQELFQLEVLVAQGLIYREMLSAEFFRALAQDRAYQALRHYMLSGERKVMEYPLADLRDGIALVARGAAALGDDMGSRPPLSDQSDAGDGGQTHVWVYRLNVTPLTTYAIGPELDIPNRVLRHYIRKNPGLIQSFLRVHFVDENQQRLRVGNAEHPLQDILDDVKRKLVEGIMLCGRRYSFLAMSNSQLREHACWFVCTAGDVSASSIRQWMGDFQGIKNVAKYAARMGQCFSSTSTSGRLVIQEHEYDIVEDIKTPAVPGQKTYTFSDGIGMISHEFAKEALTSTQLKTSGQAAAFQIRFAGFKGVVAVSCDLPRHLKLRLRPSMRKFESSHLQLEVIQVARRFPGHLNREIILLLSTLGIKDDVFIGLQRGMIGKLNLITEKRKAAMVEIARSHCLQEVYATTTTMHAMMAAGISPGGDPYLQGLLLAYRQNYLLNLEDKAHINVEKAALLMGVLDESKTLDYGEVLIQISERGDVVPIIGRVAIAKNPCLHPGDIRLLNAVRPPSDNAYLSALVNCLVFPAKGKRPHPDECSGSDLDGDQYFVTWEPALLPLPGRIVEPADYDTAPPLVQHAVTIEKICKFFTDYMKTDVLGQICIAHQAKADTSPRKALDPICRELAEMQSTAVDYPKTGVVVEMKIRHRPKEFPDFLKKTSKNSYRSQKVIGKLFRTISNHKPPLFERAGLSINEALIVDGMGEYLDDAQHLLYDYNQQLAAIMRRYGVWKEAEAVGGYMVKVTSRHHRRQKLQDVQAQVRLETLRLRQHYYEQNFTGLDPVTRWSKASAWYYAAYDSGPTAVAISTSNKTAKKGAQYLLSFGWIPYSELCDILKSRKPIR